jgi:curved DNA-binding protein CbpA
MINYYQVLGINEKASKEQIKRAYKRISVKVHPDKFDGDKYHTEIFQLVNEAQQVLTDEAKRAEYDAALHRSINPYSRSVKDLFRINFTLNRRSIFLLSTIAAFLIFVFFVPSSDMNQLHEQRNLAELKALSRLKQEGNKSVEPMEVQPIVAVEKRNDFSTKDIRKLPEPKPALTQINRSLQQTAAVNEISENERVPQSATTSENLLELNTGQNQYDNAEPVHGERSTNKSFQKRLSEMQMTEILEKVNVVKATAGNKINCVKILKAKNSNVENAFDLAAFFKNKGFIISGREPVKTTVEGTDVSRTEGCIYVTVGSY